MNKVQKLIFSCMFVLSGCGSAELDQDPSTITEHPEPSQPYSFEEVGDYISGMPIDLAPLPSGNWLVATRDGHILLLNWAFEIIAHTSIPTETFNDSGLFSLVLDPNFVANRYVYVYRTIVDCGDVYCNALTRFTLKEDADIIHEETEIAVFPMINRYGYHQGGGLAFGPDGYLYLAVGDGSPDPDKIASVVQQTEGHFGKLLRIDTESLEYQVAAMGLRNPFTATATEAGLVVADVGGEAWEELNLVPWGGNTLNFGWPLEEGPGESYDNPLLAIKHCDETNQDQDPAQHAKNHGGVVHECDNTSIVVAGYHNGTVIYSELYSGYVRGVSVDGTKDRHLGHMPGLTALEKGPDGFLYGVSLFSGRVVRLTPEIH